MKQINHHKLWLTKAFNKLITNTHTHPMFREPSSLSYDKGSQVGRFVQIAAGFLFGDV